MAQLKRKRLSSEAQALLEGAEYALGAAFLGGRPQAAYEALLFLTHPDRLLLLTDVANLRDASAVRWFWGRWQGKIVPEWKEDLIEIRNGLREIWLALDSPAGDRIVGNWLSWRPSELHREIYKHIGLEFGQRLPSSVQSKPAS